MRLPYFRKPTRYVPSPQREGSLQDYRDRIITILIASALTLGALSFIVAAIPAANSGQYWTIVVYAVCYAWILIVSFQRRRFSYTVQVFSISSIFYVLGMVNLIQNGLSADGGVFLLSFTVVVSLMIGGRSGLFALMLSMSSFALVGFLMSSGYIIPPVVTDYRESMDWVSGGTVLLLLSTILTLSLDTILRGLNNSIGQVRILAIDTDRDREQLRLRSQELQRRLAQLRVAAEIEHTISAVLDPKDLMKKVVDLLGERFGLYHVGVFMLSENTVPGIQTGEDVESNRSTESAYYGQSGTEVVLQAGTGKIIPVGYRMNLTGATNAGWAIANRKPRAIETSPKRDALSSSYLPLAHTELALPLISQERVTGVLMIHSTQSDAFDADDIALFQSAADSLAIALENAQLFKQNQDDLEEIRTLQKQYLSRAWSETTEAQGNLSYTFEAEAVSQDQNEAADSNITSYSTPISLRDQTIGSFTMETDKPAWAREDRAFIESVITEAALALENARLLNETQQRANHDRLIADITRTVQASTDIETILSSAIRELGRKLRASEAVISLRVVSDDEKQAGGVVATASSPGNDDKGEIDEHSSAKQNDDYSEQQEVSA
jgi:GAF domain-containing protein